MREFLKRLSPKTEFAVVILVAFGTLVYGSVSALLHPASEPPPANRDLLILAAYECVQMAVLGLFLWARGWSLEKVGLTPGVRDTVLGVALFIAYYCVLYALWTVAAAIAPLLLQDAPAWQGEAHVSRMVAVLLALINPIFEEVFVCGYVIAALKRDDSPWLAINVSVALRLCYHIHDGRAVAISIIPLGLIFAWWFARSGRLWPVVVAHTMLDLLSLLAIAKEP